MGISTFSRRQALAIAAGAVVMPKLGTAEEVVDLNWDDLLPEGQTGLAQSLQGVVQHDQSALASQQPEATGFRSDWNGKIVRLPGYMVPIEYEGTGVTAFLLVPFIGACVHVPPPPANQLVLVQTNEPYESEGLFEAVNVTGMFGASASSLQIADVGYVISAEKIAPFY
ncbi:DUF3299 domain-containing protein [Halocynthiibacter sp. C4]|uniref:DUF3299 domain-containing protein n=1 Tax=Halocynthiibacter sp. C4 TaxID=2992758 RepID=UPI00237C1DCA|nr:DUF3299 domain-containing protein [Halocynthiibacter sp. C4]MDE0588558.1 DUF3299 domain-containing protein [Halocynthiibacter sp. C4]